MDFDENESDNDQVCFPINNIYFAQSDLVTQAEIKTELGPNILFQIIMKRIKSGHWKQRSEAEKGFEQPKDSLTINNETFSEVLFLSFHPNYVTRFWQKRMRHIPGRMQLRHQSERYHCGLALPKTFNTLLVNVRIQSLRGQKPTSGNGSTWTGVMLKTKAIS